MVASQEEMLGHAGTQQPSNRSVVGRSTYLGRRKIWSCIQWDFHFSRMATPVMAVELRPSTAQARIPSLRGYRDRKSIVCVPRMWIDSSLLPALGPRVLLMLRQSTCKKKNDHPVKSVAWTCSVACVLHGPSAWSHGPHACHVRNKKKGPVKGMHATLYT
jgi:hypothetical protein